MDTSQHISEIATLARQYKLEFVALFGSQATGTLHKKSDVDIAVISHSPVDAIKLAVAFDTILGRDDVEVVNLAKASPTLMYAVARDGKVLYEENENAFLRWRVYAAKIWMDTEWLRNIRDAKLVEWAKTK